MPAGRSGIWIAVAAAALIAAAPASAGLTLVESSGTTTPSGGEAYAEAECPGGSKVAGGGAYTSGGFAQVAIVTSYPGENDTWKEWTDVYTGPQTHYAYAICDTDPVVTNKESRKLGVDKTGTVQTRCPAGKNLYGGGFYTDAQYGESDALVSAPDGDGWRAKLHNYAGDKIKIVAYALCGSKASRVETKSSQVKPGEEDHATAKCSGNDRLTGGGIAIASNTDATWITSLYPPTNHSFKSYAVNTSGNKHRLTSYAICR